ncbi:hypothetical protein [Neotabrizicola sp. sgz301269]|uniref:hypothetical protein n=1 Tax=Neotabrizicola sp. sgz301269 TaxID=3276282 RepID=UPI00376F939F
MSAWRTAPDGLAAVGWRFLALVVTGLWLAPALLGWLAYLVIGALGAAQLGESYRLAEALALLAAYSPLASWGGFALIFVGTLFLLRRGAFGWASAFLLGAFAGLSLSLHTGEPTPVLIGVFLTALLRVLLALKAPDVF